MDRAPIPEIAATGFLASIGERRSELAALCRQFHVRTLELFGSAAGASFDPQRSDLDLLVEFEPLPPADYATAFFAFQQALEQLFARPVDLVVSSAIRNPYFRQSVEKSKALLYAA